jgi:hypothetical protein
MRRVVRGARGALIEARVDRAHRHRPAPPVFCNSVHKAGTHLLVGVVTALPGYDALGGKAYWHDLSRALVDARSDALDVAAGTIAGCRRGEVIRGHVGYTPGIAALIRDHGVRHTLIVRDPRDVVVSNLHWWQRNPGVDTWPLRHFTTLGDDRRRLELLVRGWDPVAPPPGVPAGVRYPDIGTRLGEYLGWFEDPGCLVVRFEDLTGEARLGEYRRIAAHVAPHLVVEQVLDVMAAGADPARSKTFRSGGSGGWRSTLPDDLAAEIVERAAPFLTAAGYEP